MTDWKISVLLAVLAHLLLGDVVGFFRRCVGVVWVDEHNGCVALDDMSLGGAFAGHGLVLDGEWEGHVTVWKEHVPRSARIQSTLALHTFSSDMKGLEQRTTKFVVPCLVSEYSDVPLNYLTIAGPLHSLK